MAIMIYYGHEGHRARCKAGTLVSQLPQKNTQRPSTGHWIKWISHRFWWWSKIRKASADKYLKNKIEGWDIILSNQPSTRETGFLTNIWPNKKDVKIKEIGFALRWTLPKEDEQYDVTKTDQRLRSWTAIYLLPRTLGRSAMELLLYADLFDDFDRFKCYQQV